MDFITKYIFSFLLINTTIIFSVESKVAWRELFQKLQKAQYQGLIKEPELKNVNKISIEFYTYCSASLIVDHWKSLCDSYSCIEKYAHIEYITKLESFYLNNCIVERDSKKFIFDYCMQNSIKVENEEFCKCKAVQMGYVQNLNCNSII